MEENHEQDRDSEVEESPLSNNEEEEANSDGDSMEVSGYGNDNEGENSTYNTNGALAAAAAELVRRHQHAIRAGNHPGLNFAEGHEREHEDILSKLKMQVRDMKVDSSQLGDLATTAANMTPNNLQDHLNSLRARAPTTPFLFAPNRGVAIPEDSNFQFTSPMQFPSQLHHFMPQAGPPPANNPGSNPPSTSPQSSEGSGGSNQNNWSFEEQFKQVRQTMYGGHGNMPNYFDDAYPGYRHVRNNGQPQMTSQSSSDSNKSNSGGFNNAYDAKSLRNGQNRTRPSVSPLTSRCRSPREGNRGRRSANRMNVTLSAAEVAEQEELQHGLLAYTNTTSTTFEQHKKKLYELTDEPARKIMLDELFSFNQRRGKHNRTPINRLPIMAKTVLDLYELFNLVVARGGLVEVINKKLWQEIIKGLKLPSSITSAAFTLRTQYMKFLFAFECDKYNLSTNEELQAAIDGNRREGRRSSYGAHYENMRPSGRSPNPVQMAQLAAVTRHQQHQEQQLINRLSSQLMANGHHPVMHPPGLGQLNGAPIPGMAMPNLNINLEQYAAAARLLVERGSPSMHPTTTQTDLNRSPSPTNHHALAAFNNNMVLFNSFLNNNNNVKPAPAPQEEALNLSEAAQTATPVKRERVDKDEEPTSPKKKSRESNNDDAPSARVPQPSNNHHSSQRTNIVINNREGDPVNGMVVNMEVNGVAYQGVLFPVTDDKVQTSNKKNGS